MCGVAAFICFSDRDHGLTNLVVMVATCLPWNFANSSSFSLGCLSGGQVEVILTGRVSGRFSDDGRSISAEEVLSYRYVGTGEQVDVRYRWAATAPAE